MKKELICVACPRGCQINVTIENNEITNISGNSCKRGEQYAYTECTNPARSLTTTVKVKNGELDVVPVKSEKAIPKGKMFDCMKEINKVAIEAPVKIGDIAVENICDTGINIVVTNNVEAL